MAAQLPVQVPAWFRLSPLKVYTTWPLLSASTTPLTPATCSVLNTTAFLGRCAGAPNADVAPNQDPASRAAETTPSTPARKPVSMTRSHRDPASGISPLPLRGTGHRA